MNLGTLYIVATPIGNLDDITQRAITVLANVDLVAAEDTRHSKKLLQHIGIDKPMTAYYDQNEQQRSDAIIEKLQQGKNIALISDAGTPLISDPGYVLVAKAHSAGIPVAPIPGPCAFVAALSAAGLATDRFIFEGFLPVKSAARLRRLAKLQRETATAIFYEAPHRIVALVEDMLSAFKPERALVIAKELTKTYETLFSGSITDGLAWLNADANHQRGEFVVLLGGAEPELDVPLSEQSIETLRVLLTELPVKKAAKLAALITGEKKNMLYDYAVKHLAQ